MKKTIQVLVFMTVLAVMLLVVSMAMAEGAEHDYHYAYCDNPGVCAEGGEPYSGDEIYHGETIVEHDADSHWDVCINCGEISGPFKHFTYCNRDGICGYCGMPYAGDNLDHSDIATLHDTDTHWDVCVACGEIIWGPYEHAASCQNLGVCYYCYVPYTGEARAHWYTLGFDANMHWDECKVCGEILGDPYNHYFYCTDLEWVCRVCGLAFMGDEQDLIDDEYWQYIHVSGKYEYNDEATHWYVCSDGWIGEPKAHTPASDDPTLCTVCGATISMPVKGTAKIDNKTGKLAIVDEDGEIVDYTGFETFEGADFYFEDGVIRDDMNGLTLIGGTWHNMDHGRFNTSDGIVFFEGGAFMVKDGLIDGAQDGLVEYNGEWFVFSNGQFQPQVYGAWPDHRSGKFVYIWGGQFYPITDLVSYDGEIFYFINGYLATDFVGTVYDFNGTPFNVVYGQVY